MLRQAALLCLLLTGITNAQRVGQMEGTATSAQIVPANTAITGFQEGEAFQGLTSENDQIKVTKEGFYFIYAQVFFETYPDGPSYHNRVALTVNGGSFALLQTGLDNRGDYGSLYTGGVIQLKPGDTIGLKTVSDCRLWVSAKHTFFGAYKI